MKKMTCPDCDKEFTADTPENMMDAMHPHYMSDHKEIIEGATPENKKEWMGKFNEEWEKAKSV
tara:strand:+ start:4114 stop:4302 length:189 start_codon:yes stop_codon:yes gene_type:complete